MMKRFLSLCLTACLFWSLPCFASAFGAADAELVTPEALTVIGEEAFSGCATASIYLQDQVTEIGERAFADCANLKVIRIPASVENIAENSFAGCSGLIIYGKPNTPAQRFAAAHGFTFRSETESDYELPEI